MKRPNTLPPLQIDAQLQRVLFVCLGNICRSPSAEGVFVKKAKAAGLRFQTDSAGTGAWHVGEPPYGAMQQAAKARGYELAHLRARQVTHADFAAFDLIVVMDDQNQRDVEALRPKGSATPVALLTDFSDSREIGHVPDPYYTRGFDETLDVVEEGVDALISHFQAAQVAD